MGRARRLKAWAYIDNEYIYTKTSSEGIILQEQWEAMQRLATAEAPSSNIEFKAIVAPDETAINGSCLLKFDGVDATTGYPLVRMVDAATDEIIGINKSTSVVFSGGEVDVVAHGLVEVRLNGTASDGDMLYAGTTNSQFPTTVDTSGRKLGVKVSTPEGKSDFYANIMFNKPLYATA